MLLLTRSDLQRCLPMRECIGAMREAFAQLSSGRADVPQRIGLEAGDGVSLFMPAHLRDSHALGLKVVSVHNENAKRGLPAASLNWCEDSRVASASGGLTTQAANRATR